METPAEVYNGLNQPQTRDAIETVKTITEKRFDIIVDIGCGTGNITLNVLGKSFEHIKIYAFDIDENMVKLASRENPSEKIFYEVGNIGDPWENLSENLKKLEGSVDLVWSNRVLHWVQDKVTMAKNIVRLMKPGGKFVANITLCKDLSPYMTPELREPEGRKIWRDWLTQDEQFGLYKNIFNDAGLISLSIEFKGLYGEYKSNEFLDFFLPASFAFYKKQRLVIEEFEKLSEGTKKKIEDFIQRNALSKLNEPPLNAIDKEQKGYYYGQYCISGTKE